MSADGLRRETILVVDDEPMVRDVLARVLEMVFATLGADLLRKPFDVDALLTRVEQLLDAR